MKNRPFIDVANLAPDEPPVLNRFTQIEVLRARRKKIIAWLGKQHADVDTGETAMIQTGDAYRALAAVDLEIKTLSRNRTI